MPLDIGINHSTINGTGSAGVIEQIFQAVPILKKALPVLRLVGRLTASAILATRLPAPWLYKEGEFEVDYAVNVDPTYLKPPRRGWRT